MFSEDDLDDDGCLVFKPGSLNTVQEQYLLQLANLPHNDETHSETATEIHCNVCFARGVLDIHYGVVQQGGR